MRDYEDGIINPYDENFIFNPAGNPKPFECMKADLPADYLMSTGEFSKAYEALLDDLNQQK
jgi:hypothetical protein